MMWTRTIALIAAIVIGAVAISTGHIQAQVEAANRRANADRKAFRVEMHRLAERQARLEGINTAARQ